MISQAHWENRFLFFLAHSVDDNEDLAFGSDGEGSDYKQRCVYFVLHMNVTRSQM